MLKSCQYCGKIHDSKIDCGKKPERVFVHKDTPERRIRNGRRWREKSIEIRERDRFLCQACIHEESPVYTYDDIEVHHIVPLCEDAERAYDNHNLISLCKYHHRMAEDGLIERRKLVSWTGAGE